MSGYELSRDWFDFCFENPEKIKPNHAAVYFYAIEVCNRLGWKKKFGFPTDVAMESVGIKSYNTYINTLNDLVSFGFVEMIEKSKNQYTANIIALSKNDKANDKAHDKALIKHMSKQSESTLQSIDSIDKQVTSKQITINKEQRKAKPPTPEIEIYRKFAHLKLTVPEKDKLISEGYSINEIDNILDAIENYRKNTNYKNLLFTARKWLIKDRGSASENINDANPLRNHPANQYQMFCIYNGKKIWKALPDGQTAAKLNPEWAAIPKEYKKTNQQKI